MAQINKTLSVIKKLKRETKNLYTEMQKSMEHTKAEKMAYNVYVEVDKLLKKQIEINKIYKDENKKDRYDNNE